MCGKCIARIKYLSRREQQGQERRYEEGKERRGGLEEGEDPLLEGKQLCEVEWTWSHATNSCFTGVDEMKNALFIYRSLIMNPPKARREAEV